MLDLFGLSVPIVQVAGGIVVCAAGWELLRSGGAVDTPMPSSPPSAAQIASRAFYPLTLPITVGPGTISVAITIGAHHPQNVRSLLLNGTADVIGAALIALTVFVCYRYADRMLRRSGRNRHERADPAVRIHPAVRRRADLLDGRLGAARARLPVPPRLALTRRRAGRSACGGERVSNSAITLHGLPAADNSAAPMSGAFRERTAYSVAGVAQLVEQRIRNAKVEGSTPSTGTTVFPRLICNFSALPEGFMAHIGKQTLIQRRLFARRPWPRIGYRLAGAFSCGTSASACRRSD